MASVNLAAIRPRPTQEWKQHEPSAGQQKVRLSRSQSYTPGGVFYSSGSQIV